MKLWGRTEPHERLGRVFLLASGVLYLACLCLPSFYTRWGDGSPQSYGSGFSLLMIGWFGMLGGVSFAWLANPLLFFAWLLIALRRHAWGLGFALPALLFAASTLTLDNIILNEAGHEGRITAMGAGYWLWIASIVMCVLSSAAPLWMRIRSR